VNLTTQILIDALAEQANTAPAKRIGADAV
jgi:hypothetical protein